MLEYLSNHWGQILFAPCGIFIAFVVWKIYRHFVPAGRTPPATTTTSRFPIHIATSLFTLIIVISFWELLYFIVITAMETKTLAWIDPVSVPWYANLIPIAMTLHSMWFCYVAPCGQKTTRQHYFRGETSPAWQSHSGQISFWIGRLLKGRLGSLYVNNVPDRGKKIVSKLYGNADDGSDSDGAEIEWSGGSLPSATPPAPTLPRGTTPPAPLPDRRKREQGKIKTIIDWRCIDAIALLSQLINEFPNVEEIKWDDEMQSRAEALFVSLHLFAEVRDVCLNVSFENIDKPAIQTEINDRIVSTVNPACRDIGVEIQILTVSEARATNPATIKALSDAALEKVQREREEENLRAVEAQLRQAITFLKTSGFAADLDGKTREAALAKEAIRMVYANNKLITPDGAALENILRGFMGSRGDSTP